MNTKNLQYMNDVGSESVRRSFGDDNSLLADISFISENNYSGMSCEVYLWQK